MAEIKEMSFEEALRRLEEIVTKLDEGELSLEEAITHFQEGSHLREYCERKLAEAETQIEELLQEAEPSGGEEVMGGLFGDD